MAHVPHYNRIFSLVTKVQVCFWEVCGTVATWSSGFPGWVCTQHVSQHLPTLLLSVTSLLIYTCCSSKACSIISSAVSYMYVSIHTSFVAVLRILILRLLRVHPLVFPALLPPSPLSWHVNIKCPNLISVSWWRDLSNTYLLEEKRRGRAWGVSQCAWCRS